ncbi:MAG: hypothetical protein GW809_07915 [Bacteroidetes bacterium]|nr:hypothetical protein [Bacteroidota bacterium]NCQ12049.1 hypothetical protein [Bacteroidota bacterium]
MHLRKIHFFFLLGLVFSINQACTESKTVVIDKKPVFIGDVSTLDDLPGEVSQTVIRIGELNKIQNLDPLFIDNHGEMRLINLVCEGLIALDSQGNLLPAIAKSWEVSNDSLTYIFTLGDKRFHNSDLFFNGLGRKVNSTDVRYVFDRMAKATVPGRTAKLFWSIRGMDIYYNEQRELFDVERRSIKSIIGIETPNDSTVIFNLDYKDQLFLNNLAKPEASIYPKENVESNITPIAEWPVGTNSWKFSGLFRDSIITLKPVSESTNLTETIKRKRLEFYFFQNEISLYKKFFLGEIDIVPEIGPQLSKTVLTADGKLSPSYQNDFNLISTVSTEPFSLYFNTENRFNITAIQAVDLVKQADLQIAFLNSPIFDKIEINQINDSLIQKKSPQTSLIEFNSVDETNRLTMNYNENPIALEILRVFLVSLSNKYAGIIIKSPVIGRESIFFIRETAYQKPANSIQLAKFYPKRSGLQKSDKIYAEFSNEPWWISIKIIE